MTSKYKYMDAATCDSLRRSADVASSLAGALRLIQAGALLSQNPAVEAEIGQMVVAMEAIGVDIRMDADRLDPRLRDGRA
jgi:hypothetical protein